MKQPKKKDARKPERSPGKLTKTTKKGRIALGEEDLSGVSGGVQKVREANYSSGGDRPTET